MGTKQGPASQEPGGGGRDHGGRDTAGGWNHCVGGTQEAKPRGRRGSVSVGGGRSGSRGFRSSSVPCILECGMRVAVLKIYQKQCWLVSGCLLTSLSFKIPINPRSQIPGGGGSSLQWRKKAVGVKKGCGLTPHFDNFPDPLFKRRGMGGGWEESGETALRRQATCWTDPPPPEAPVRCSGADPPDWRVGPNPPRRGRGRGGGGSVGMEPGV